MFGYEKIDLSFSFNSIFFFVGLILLAAYSIYVYRFTLPPVSKYKKIVLTLLRASALIILLFIFFEPVLTLTKKNILTPLNLFFIDNSKSITIKDGTDRINSTKNVIDKVESSSLNGEKQFYSFGSDVNQINKDSLDKFLFTETSTDFSKIFSNINHSQSNIASITIISDGVITQGSTPTYSAEKTGIPVFTVGVGDSSKKNDVEIKNVINNEFIYAETPTTVLATILNKGFIKSSTQVSLYENSKLIEQKSIELDQSGVNSVSFNYTPKQSGEKKLSVRLNNLKGESNALNNQKVFYVNVLSNKINILLIAGSPSPDLTFIKDALTIDNNLQVNTLTQITQGNFLEQNHNAKLDSADIIYLIGFPTNTTNDDFLNRLTTKLENRNIPFFLFLSSDVDNNKLKRLNDLLPVLVSTIDKNYLQIQPDIQLNEIDNPLIHNNPVNDWNNLPPINQPMVSLTVKPESKIISKVKINNQPRNNPLIVSRNFGSKRSVVLIGKDFWKWKLQTANKNLSLFDNFIMSSTRWLNAPDDQKKVRIKTSKKIYSSGELVEFTAQVYDESFNPVSEAEVKVKINGQNTKNELVLNSLGAGLYEGSILLNNNGDYNFNGDAIFNSKLLGKDNGVFNIGDIDLEMIDTRMNYEFLYSLSNQTKGIFYSPDEINSLIIKLNELNQSASKEKLTTSEIRLWSDEWLLVVLVLLFALEWFLRKRSGML